jgi:hypothetical protein
MSIYPPGHTTKAFERRWGTREYNTPSQAVMNDIFKRHLAACLAAITVDLYSVGADPAQEEGALDFLTEHMSENVFVTATADSERERENDE